VKRDIQNRADIELLVNDFYTKVMKDEILAPFFSGHLQLNFAEHKPIMVDFWEFNLFQTPMIYMRNVMNPHLELNKKMPMCPAHFETWIAIFNATVDELFEGEKANQAKDSAFTIGTTMQYKIKKINEV
jgi:hemoglobin